MTEWQPPPTWGAPAPPGPPLPGVGPGGRFGWYKRWPLLAKIVAPIAAVFTILVIIGAITGPPKQQNTVAVAPVTSTTNTAPATSTTTVAPITTTAAPTTTTSTAVTPDELFQAAIGYNSGKFGTDLPDVSDSTLTGLGRAACSDFDNGASVQQVEMDAYSAEGSTGLSAGQMGTIIGSAVEVYCPKYNPQLLAIGPPTS